MLEKITVDNINAIVYHGGCPDGTWAAAIIRHFIELYHKTNKNDPPDIKLVPKHPSNDGKILDLMGMFVIVVDVSFTAEAYKNLQKICAGILVLDHHIDNANTILDSGVDHIYDLDKCGASLAYAWCMQQMNRAHSTIPAVIDAIERQDLWKQDGKPEPGAFAFWFSANINGHKYYENNKYLAELFARLEDDAAFADFIAPKIYHFDETMKTLRKSVLSNTLLQLVEFSIRGKKVLRLVGFYISENKSYAGSEVMHQFPLLDCACITYPWILNHETPVSFRAHDWAPPCNEIAKLYNGGGHRNAAGGVLPGATFTCGSLVGPFYQAIQKIQSINFPGDINIAFVNSQSKKKKIADYLAQNKDEGKPYSVADFVIAVNNIEHKVDWDEKSTFIAELDQIKHTNPIHGVVVYSGNRACVSITSNGNADAVNEVLKDIDPIGTINNVFADWIKRNL